MNVSYRKRETVLSTKKRICILVEPKPPKVSKSARRRRNRYKPRLQHTLNDKYNAEEIRSTPQGDRLFRLFGSRWVEMA